LPKAKTAAIKAIEIDNTLAEAHTSLAAIKECYDWDWLGAETEFKRAIELNSNYAVAHYWYAEFLSEMGRFDEAITEIKRAQELDPLSLIISSVKGFIFYMAGEYDQGIEQCQKTLEMYPNFHGAHHYLGLIYLEKGMYGEALKEFKKADSQALIGITYAKMNKMAAAQQVLDSLIEQSRCYILP
jgi:tetratricopeptide (TPR) repeat protein